MHSPSSGGAGDRHETARTTARIETLLQDGSRHRSRADRFRFAGRRRRALSGGPSMLRRALTAVTAVLLLSSLTMAVADARKPSPPGYAVADVGAYGGEPSIV